MENLGYYNGEYGRIEDMKIPMTDRVCYFGDGVYDATCAHNHVIYSLEEHIDRFYNSARLLEIRIPHTKEKMAQILRDMVKKVDSGDQFVYWQATRGSAIRNHAYGNMNFDANIWIMLTPTEKANTYKKVHLVTEKDTRFYHCNIKTLNLIPSVMAAEKARACGADETVFYRDGGRVTECAHSNVSILKDGVFRTAPTDCLILPGIARRHLIKACGALDIPVDESAFYLEDLMNADEVIVSSSSCFCLQAVSIDGKPVGGKAPELLGRLQQWLTDDFENYCKG